MAPRQRLHKCVLCSLVPFAVCLLSKSSSRINHHHHHHRWIGVKWRLLQRPRVGVKDDHNNLCSSITVVVIQFEKLSKVKASEAAVGVKHKIRSGMQQLHLGICSCDLGCVLLLLSPRRRRYFCCSLKSRRLRERKCIGLRSLVSTLFIRCSLSGCGGGGFVKLVKLGRLHCRLRGISRSFS